MSMRLLYTLASGLRRTYWYLVRPKTRGVKCLIECDDSYLLIRHAYGSRMYNWNLPGGGVKKNEEPSDAIRREVKEELSIQLSEVSEIKKYTSSAEYKVDTIHCFYGRVTSKDFIPNESELQEAR